MTKGADDKRWSEYERLVLYRLDAMEAELKELHDDVVKLKVSSGIWGGVTGFVVSILAAIAQVMGK